ncbi:DUF2157 domain-containing protein [Glaciimonas sp. GG7]
MQIKPSDLRPIISRWLQEKQLSPAAGERALALSGNLPDGTDWKHFLEKVCLFSGALFLVVGVIFFFAFNWQELPRLAKFSLLQGMLITAALLAHRFTLDTAKGQAAMLAAMLLCGALLAYFGQTYQTGADPYQLFLTWSMLIFPWVLISRLNTAWCLWLGLLNLALVLYVERDTLDFFVAKETENGLMVSVFWLNLVVWAGAEISVKVSVPRSYQQSEVAVKLYKYRYFIRFAGLLVLAALTLGTIYFIFLRTRMMAPSLWINSNAIAMLVVLAGFFVLYRRRHDLPLLSASCLALIVIGAVQLDVLFFPGLNDSSPFNLMAIVLFLVGTSTIAALWLRSLQRRWRQKELA